MCGILAYINFNRHITDQDLMVRMRDTMTHRGPDGAGILFSGHVCLAHRRLAIIDLSDSGKQPMSNEDGTIFLVVNGEIYNYIELKEILIKKGHVFCSNSDSELILHQYEEDGINCIDKFNGMFAFVIWDKRNNLIFAARDRIGIKPIYYYMYGDKLILSSEIKAILEDDTVKRSVDLTSLVDYLYAGRALGNKTIFSNIKELEPGYLMLVNLSNRELTIKKYWDVNYKYDHSRTEQQLMEELDDLLDSAVKIHCRSDAPLGNHLSGGLDSSTIAALTAKHRKNLKTFSIKFSNDPAIDETRYAKEVAAYVGADYYESSPNAVDMADALPFLIWHMDTPMTSVGGFAYYTVSNLAKKYVKVTMTGHGGDEVFAGYPAQFQAAFGRLDMFSFHPGSAIRRQPFGRRLIEFIREKDLRDVNRYIRRKFSRPTKTFEEKWVRGHCNYLMEDNTIFNPECIKIISGYSSRELYLQPFKSVNTNLVLDKCLYHDLRVYLPSLLHLEDRVSMALSIESRVPLLDYRIVEYLATVPPEQKVFNRCPKYLLRKVASSLLPESIWGRRDKFPFPVPEKFWFTEKTRNLTKDILLDKSSLDRGIFKPKSLKAAWNSYDISTLWDFVNVELWFKIFIDRNPIWLDKIENYRINKVVSIKSPNISYRSMGKERKHE